MNVAANNFIFLAKSNQTFWLMQLEQFSSFSVTGIIVKWHVNKLHIFPSYLCFAKGLWWPLQKVGHEKTDYLVIFINHLARVTGFSG